MNKFVDKIDNCLCNFLSKIDWRESVFGIGFLVFYILAFFPFLLLIKILIYANFE